MVSVYIRPQGRLLLDSDAAANMDWIEALCDVVRGPLLIGADFNVRHTKWGYADSSLRGNNLVEVTDRANIILLNDGTPTRCVPQRNQETAPDLTWASMDILALHGLWGKKPYGK